MVDRSSDGLAVGQPAVFIERAGVPCVIRDRAGRPSPRTGRRRRCLLWRRLAHNQQANTGRGYHAIAPDGTDFRQLADVAAARGGNGLGNALETGGVLRYSGSGTAVWSATSPSGASWILDAGWRAPAGDPAPVALGSGEVTLIAVGEPCADARPLPF